MYSLQKEHCKTNRLPWSDAKAQASAKEAFDRLFHLKWTPPGRGLWVMGTPIVNVQKNSAALQNCAFVSSMEMTKNDPSRPFTFLMEASMLGVGVGFDDKGADKEFTIYEPKNECTTVVIPDTREGWVDSVSMIINSYLKADQNCLEFDYSEIRPAGAPISTFGGTAAGQTHQGRLTLIRISGNIWTAEGSFSVTSGTVQMYVIDGTLTLGGVLDRVRITTVNGTDAFDAGTINILYE
jgi:hypothetical protein